MLEIHITKEEAEEEEEEEEALVLVPVMPVKFRAHLWVGITIRAMAPPNVHLVLCGFLIDGVVKVNSVSVLQSVVPPQQQATNSHHKDNHFMRKTQGESNRQI